MCISVWLLEGHPLYKLLLVSNRDEFFGRPTAKAHRWEEDKHVVAGRDGEKGGTWLGVTDSGRLAFVTNFRDGIHDQPGLSRGKLTSDYLQSADSPWDFVKKLEEHADEFHGFNLVVADLHVGSMVYCTNRCAGKHAYYSEDVSSGIHGLSNANLDDPWPKVVRGRELLQAFLQDVGDKEVPVDKMMDYVLSDTTHAREEDLPSTGISRDSERMLSPIFVSGQDYGTRCMTGVAVDRKGQTVFCERYREGSTWKEHTLILSDPKLEGH